MKNEIIKVALADDHILLRNALASMINKNEKLKVIFEATNGKELIEQFKSNIIPDVVILDLNMPHMNGYETANFLNKNYPEVKTLMLTMYDSELALIRLLKVGVKGFMKKDIHPTELLFAIDSVHKNGYYYSPQTSSKLAGLFRDDDSINFIDKIMLNESEISFLKLVCTEMTYKEIASELNLNPRSIDSMRDNLFTRLDIKSRVGLAMFAIKHGIVIS
ncbi:MAG: response regulator [Chitinophagaceae bacterium]|jgi:two-component system invasion response regulator UvrY